MFLETPELANAAATKKIDTRVPNDPNNTSAVAGPLEGSPEPWLFTDVQRTMAINTADLGRFNDADVARVDQYSTALPASQTFNVLAMAAPKLNSPADAATLPVVMDLFNTFVAGFTLAKQGASVSSPLINTGALGAGVFNNSRQVVFVLQDLAARYVGVNLQFWDYDPSTPDTLEAQYVQPILARYQADAAANPGLNNNILHLVTLASDALQGSSPPAASLADDRRRGRGPGPHPIQSPGQARRSALGRPGLPVQHVDGPRLAGPAGNYKIAFITQKRVRGQVKTTYNPIRIYSVTTDPNNTSVTVATRSYTSNYPKGGRVVLTGTGPGGLTSAAGVSLGQDVTFNITPRASSIDGALGRQVVGQHIPLGIRPALDRRWLGVGT